MAAKQRVVVVAAVVLLACIALPTARGLNITSMLKGYPMYSKYLTLTKVSDEINAREAVTVLVLGDNAMSKLVDDAGGSLAGIKNALRLTALLDYFDAKKMRALPDGTAVADTLYQAAGDDMGTVKIDAAMPGGKFGFASANPGAKFDATVVKAIKAQPYKLSIMEVSAPIEFDGLFDAPLTTNLRILLERAGCKKFAALAAGSGVLKEYEAAMGKGLTLFAANDDAFHAKGAPNFDKMSSADVATVLRYHALPEYNPKTSLKTVKRALRTLASNAAGKYNITVVTHGDDVTLDTGVDKSRVASTVIDNAPMCVLTVGSLLMPVELFGDAPAAAPGPAAPTPSPAPSAADAPLSSPPAPAPADAESKPADHKDVKASSAVALRSVVALAAAACSVVLASVL